MGSITGAKSAKKAAQAQAAALEEQTRLAQQSAQEAARQASIQTASAQAREQATEAVSSMQQEDAARATTAEVDTGSTNETSTNRKRARFQSGGQSLTSLSI